MKADQIYYCRFCGYSRQTFLTYCPGCGSTVPLKEWD